MTNSDVVVHAEETTFHQIMFGLWPLCLKFQIEIVWNWNAANIQFTQFFSPKIKVSALEALKEPNLRLLSDLLSSDATADGDLAVDVNKAYAEEKVN